MELQKNGDALAERVLKRYESRLSRGLAMVANLLDPDIFVLGGGMSNIERLYQTLPKMIPEWTFGKEFKRSHCSCKTWRFKRGEGSRMALE